MKRRSLVSTAMFMSLALVLLPFSMGQAQAAAQPGVESGNQEQIRVDAEMISHQRAMDILFTMVRKDFQAVVVSKDANGYVHDKAAVKTYERDLSALRVIARQHKQLATDYEHWCAQAFTTDYVHWCGPDVKENAMAEHQKQMDSAIDELTSTFHEYLNADDHSIDQPYVMETALEAHRDALEDFAGVIKDHEHAVARMTVNGAGHSNTQSGPVSASTSVILPSASSHASLADRR